MKINFRHARRTPEGPRIAGHTRLGIHNKAGEGPALKRRSLWAVSLTCMLLGCATLKGPFESRGEERLQQSLEALERGDYRTAHEGLSWVAEHYSKDESGQQATLILAALELDPRNPGRRIAVGTDVAAAYLRAGDKPAWTQPLAQTLYLLGLELGAAEERVEKAEREAERAVSRLPALPGPTVSARIRTVEQERDRLARRVETLEKQLSEKDQELQRIKKTIRQ
jgi:hypothetical protein